MNDTTTAQASTGTPPSITLTFTDWQAQANELDRLMSEVVALKRHELVMGHRRLAVEDVARCLIDLSTLASDQSAGNVAAGLQRAAWRLVHHGITGWADHMTRVQRLGRLEALEASMKPIFDGLAEGGDVSKEELFDRLTAHFRLKTKTLD